MLISKAEAFAQKFTIAHNGCWIWQRYPVAGYGNHTVDGKTQRAHRVAYEMIKGKIPDGLVIDHLCLNKMCVNPTHLEAVPQRINILRGTSPQAKFAARTHCNKGHEFTEKNTIIRENGGRRCRVCYTKYHKEYRNINRKDINSKIRLYQAIPEVKAHHEEQRRVWYAKNRDKMLAYYKEYNETKRVAKSKKSVVQGQSIKPPTVLGMQPM